MPVAAFKLSRWKDPLYGAQWDVYHRCFIGNGMSHEQAFRMAEESPRVEEKPLNSFQKTASAMLTDCGIYPALGRLIALDCRTSQEAYCATLDGPNIFRRMQWDDETLAEFIKAKKDGHIVDVAMDLAEEETCWPDYKGWGQTAPKLAVMELDHRMDHVYHHAHAS